VSIPYLFLLYPPDVDGRLNRLLGDVIISQGGVVPFINPELLPTKSGKGKKDGASQEV
jgi:histone H2A